MVQPARHAGGYTDTRAPSFATGNTRQLQTRQSSCLVNGIAVMVHDQGLPLSRTITVSLTVCQSQPNSRDTSATDLPHPHGSTGGPGHDSPKTLPHDSRFRSLGRGICWRKRGADQRSERKMRSRGTYQTVKCSGLGCCGTNRRKAVTNAIEQLPTQMTGTAFEEGT